MPEIPGITLVQPNTSYQAPPETNIPPWLDPKKLGPEGYQPDFHYGPEYLRENWKIKTEGPFNTFNDKPVYIDPEGNEWVFDPESSAGKSTGGIPTNGGWVKRAPVAPNGDIKPDGTYVVLDTDANGDPYRVIDKNGNVWRWDPNSKQNNGTNWVYEGRPTKADLDKITDHERTKRQGEDDIVDVFGNVWTFHPEGKGWGICGRIDLTTEAYTTVNFSDVNASPRPFSSFFW